MDTILLSTISSKVTILKGLLPACRLLQIDPNCGIAVIPLADVASARQAQRMGSYIEESTYETDKRNHPHPESKG